MRHSGFRYFLAATVVATLMGLPALTEQAGGQAFGGGYVEGPRGGGAAGGPDGERLSANRRAAALQCCPMAQHAYR